MLEMLVNTQRQVKMVESQAYTSPKNYKTTMMWEMSAYIMVNLEVLQV